MSAPFDIGLTNSSHWLKKSAISHWQTTSINFCLAVLEIVMRYSGIDTEAIIRALDNERHKLLTVSIGLAATLSSLVLFSAINQWLA